MGTALLGTDRPGRHIPWAAAVPARRPDAAHSARCRRGSHQNGSAPPRSATRRLQEKDGVNARGLSKDIPYSTESAGNNPFVAGMTSLPGSKLWGCNIYHSERTARKKDWRRTIGMFDGDPIMQEIMAEGRRLREKDRRQGHT